MKQFASNSFRGATSLERETRLSYFIECSRMVSAYKFKRPIDRKIMELYAEGKSKKEIQDELKESGIKRTRQAIYSIIWRHLAIFGLNGK